MSLSVSWRRPRNTAVETRISEALQSDHVHCQAATWAESNENCAKFKTLVVPTCTRLEFLPRCHMSTHIIVTI